MGAELQIGRSLDDVENAMFSVYDDDVGRSREARGEGVRGRRGYHTSRVVCDQGE